MAKVKVRKIDNGKISREELLSRIGIERYNSLMESAATNNVALAIPEGLPQKIDESITNEMLGQIAKVFGTSQDTIKESFEDYEKAVRQTKLKRTWFGEIFNNLENRKEKGRIIKDLIDRGLIKDPSNQYYEDFLVDMANEYEYEDLEDIIHNYVEQWDTLNEKSKKMFGESLGF